MVDIFLFIYLCIYFLNVFVFCFFQIHKYNVMTLEVNPMTTSSNNFITVFTHYSDITENSKYYNIHEPLLLLRNEERASQRCEPQW